MTKRYWTPDEEKQFREFYCEQGLTMAEIGRRMGRSEDSIRKHRDKTNLQSRRNINAGIVYRVPSEASRVKSPAEANRLHLVDLLREYGGDRLGFAKERYRQRNELLILPGSDLKVYTYSGVDRSYCGSPAAVTAGF